MNNHGEILEVVQNIVECSHCGSVIESQSRHDYVTCKCGKTSTDGGLEYFRRSEGAIDRSVDIIITSKQLFKEVLPFLLTLKMKNPINKHYHIVDKVERMIISYE